MGAGSNGTPPIGVNGAHKTPPRHVAIVMDGNGRWARKRILPRIEGHRQGAKSVRQVVEESRRLGIRYLTLFAFSTENWNRPNDEVSSLMKLFLQYLESEAELLQENDIRLRAIGDLARLPRAVGEALSRCLEKTAHCRSMDLILAISYGGRDEITSAARVLAAKALRGEISPEEINESVFRQSMYAPDVPDPDLLIRTSDESRISNFLLWQLAYSEIVVTSVLWPDFSKEEFQKCLDEYARRDRRFGMTHEQVAELRGINRGA